MGEGAGTITRKWALNSIPGECTRKAGEYVDGQRYAAARADYERKNLRKHLMHEVRDAVLEMTKKGGRTLSDMINEICTRLEEKRATVESGIPEEGIRGDSMFTEENFRKMVDDMLRRAAKNVLSGNSKIADGYDER